jgi:DNA-binding transcriptional MocR family regulator
MHCNFDQHNVIIVTMTSWMPDIKRTGAPIYIEIADAMAHDIDSGMLKSGEKLPPQRNLAFDIGVTIGTIGRAYALARQRGLVTGEVGRGTYVRSETSSIAPSITHLPGYARTESDAVPDGTNPVPGKLRLDSTSAPEVGQSSIITRHVAQIMASYPDKATDYIRSLKPEWQQAGQAWLATGGWQPELSSIVPTLGVHAGMMAAIAALSSPGDRIAFESVTYASLARATSLIGRRPISVPINEDGLDVDQFEHICANQHPKIVVVIPTIQNPTTAIMPQDTREKLAAVARKHNVWIIEDNIYGACIEDTTAPIAANAPDITFHLGGLSKLVAAGIRAGWVSCPKGFAGSLPIAHKMMTGGMPFMLAETAARIVLSGEANTISRAVRRENEARLEIVKQVMDGTDFRYHRQAAFIWLKLPDPWRASLFVSSARDLDILIDGDDEFQFSQDQTTLHRVRIAFSTPPTHEVLHDALLRLRRLMDAGPSGYDSYA